MSENPRKPEPLWGYKARTISLEGRKDSCPETALALEGLWLASNPRLEHIWVKIMVPFWVPIIVRHLIFRVPKKGP